MNETKRIFLYWFIGRMRKYGYVQHGMQTQCCSCFVLIWSHRLDLNVWENMHQKFENLKYFSHVMLASKEQLLIIQKNSQCCPKIWRLFVHPYFDCYNLYIFGSNPVFLFIIYNLFQRVSTQHSKFNNI